MSAPSWLTEENISTAQKVAKTPAVQQAAKNPAVQATAKSAAKSYAKDNSPGWTSKNTDEESVNSQKQVVDPVSSKSTASKSSVPTLAGVSEETMLRMKNFHIGLRLLYISAAGLLITSSVLSLQGGVSDVGITFIAFYVLFFAVMIVLFEIGLVEITRSLAINFGFMYTRVGRMLFCLIVGFQAFCLSLIGKIAMAWLFAVMLFHIYLYWKFEHFEEFLRKTHYYEGRIEEIKKQNMNKNSKANML